MQRPSLRQLEYAVALADRRSFRRAAEACFVSQPALSAQIAQLEERLGLRLFERDRRGVLITAAGSALIERARVILEEVNALVEAGRALGTPLTGDLRMGIIPTLAPYTLPRGMAAVRKRFPKLRLLLREDQTAHLVDLLHRGELDLLFLALEVELGEVETRPIYRDRFVVAVPRDHPLASRHVIRESDLEDERVLMLDDGHCLRDQTLAICKLAGAQEVGDFRASTLNTLVRMVASGVGLALLPEMAIRSEIHARDGLAILPLVRRIPGRLIGLAWRRTSARGEEFEQLAQVLRDCAPTSVEKLS